MQSFEQAPLGASDGKRASVKPFNERKRKPRFVDPEMEEEAMPDTRRTGNAPEKPKQPEVKREEKPVEDAASIERIQERMAQPERVSPITAFDNNATFLVNQAYDTVTDLKTKMLDKSFSDASFQRFRQELLEKRNELMDLQQKNISSDAFNNAALRHIQDKIHDGVIMIQNELHEAEGRLRERAVVKNWSLDKPWASEERARIRKAPVDQEAAALASKFANSAKKMETQKKSLWSRFKSLFS